MTLLGNAPRASTLRHPKPRTATHDRHHQAPARHGAGVDQEVEHDAEEIEPAGRLALFRNWFDAELLDAGGLTVALAQTALDVDCGSHGQFCAPPPYHTGCTFVHH